MNREYGFYWVKDDDGWFIAEWRDGDKWITTGNPLSVWFEDIDFIEIDEKRIIRND